MRTCIWLEGHGIKSGPFGQPVFQFGKHSAVAFRLIGGDKGVDGNHLRPAQRHHLSGSVQLHGAGAQRDHAAVQRDVFGLQTVEVAHHLSLTVMGIKNGMTEEPGLTNVQRGKMRLDGSIRIRLIANFLDAE